MISRVLRSMGVVPLAITGAAALSVSHVIIPGGTAGLKTVRAEAKLVDTESWIMGGSGLPIPPESYLDEVSKLYIDPSQPFFDGQPQFPVDITNALFTPEGLYPNSGVKSLPLDTSVAQGVSILNSTINSQVADGNNLVVLGYSQSSTISTLEMRDLLALPADEQPSADQLSFVLLGDPNNPDGGLFERFDLPAFGTDYPTIASMGITFNGATPADTPWDTAIYTLEYDGYADFPRYPINLLSDLNAVLGIEYEHTIYPDLTAAQLAAAIELPVTADYTGNTDYFVIPSDELPLLEPLQSIPVIGQPLYDLLEPDMRILVNLGYGSITDGWDSGPANVATPFELFPPDLNWNDVTTALESGAQQGISAFETDISTDMSEISNGGLSSLLDSSSATSTTSLSDLFTALSSDFSSPTALATTFTDIVNALSSAASSAYAALLPTADLINTLLTSAPAYAATVFADELAAGDPLDAIGLPIAGLLGLGSVGIGYEYIVIEGALTAINADFASLIP